MVSSSFLFHPPLSIVMLYYTYYAPNFEKVGSILVSACAFVRPSVRSKKKFKLGF